MDRTHGTSLSTLAIGDSTSRDLYILARVAMEDAIKTEADLLALLPQREPLSPRTAGMSGLRPTPDISGAAGHVG